MRTLTVEPSNRVTWRARPLVATVLVMSTVATGLTGFTEQAEAVTDTSPSFEVIASDLEHILDQIKIAERHADGHDLLCEDPNDDSGVCIPDARLPWGLRTVDGSHNNLLEGQSTFGAADQPFPRLLPMQLRAGEPIPPGAPGGAPGTPTNYSRTSGFVYDSQPRTISNLIVDQTETNPAAVAVAEKVEDSEIFDHDDDPSTPDRIFIPNKAPDEGLSAPFNTWMTFFGQFFDHGLDMVNKGGSGTVVVPLKPDDPLYDPSSNTNFIMLTRATNEPGPDGVLGTSDDIRNHNNQTTPFVDQNQTYTSHPSHQVFVREYTASGGVTGNLLDGADGGLANWAEVKAQAQDVLGVQLDDMDVLNVPLLLTDPYGNFIPGPGGNVQYALEGGDYTEADGGPVPDNAMRTNHAFLDDIAHTAAPASSAGNPRTCAAPDGDGNQPNGTYDCELLEAHFITGDGRGNENIGLTSVHHIFHAEHNRLVGHVQDVLNATPALRARYQNQAYASGGLRWSYGQRVFQAARFVTEMQYQHLVFEEFGRTIQPEIDEVPANESGYHTNIDAAIVAEFAHVVYRFGHSMLTEDIHRTGFGTQDTPLLDGFLNPREFTMDGAITPDQAAGSLVTGAVANPGSGIDEFVTDTLRNELLGLPLDLPAINIARGRDTGVPPLQTARKTFYDATGDLDLKPYSDWTDFGNAMKFDESLVNFIAAYGTHPSITGASTVEAKRTAAQVLIDSDDPFLTQSAATSGLNDVDFWMGGLAEAPIPFVGFLGTSFNYVFETQMENLQFGDRFYYLSRNIGLNLFHQLEANSFSSLIMRTTDATTLPAEVFQTPDLIFDLNEPDPAAWTPLGMTRNATTGEWRYVGDLHINVHGTPGNDRARGGIGDDALWGYDGDDDLVGGAGANSLVGGHGRDVLHGMGGDDNIKGGAGNDAIHGGSGLDLLLGGSGSDFIVHGSDPTVDFAGTGNDFVLGGNAHDILTGNEGDDWLEGASGSDLVQGDNANGFQDDPNGGHDVLSGGPGNDDMDAEGGDDIMISSAGTDRFEGMLGFDWVTHKGESVGANADMDNTVFQPPAQQNMRDRYDLVEALSGWNHGDVLRGVGKNDDTTGEGHQLTQAHLNRVGGLRALLGGGQEPIHAAPFMTTNTNNNIILGGDGSDLIEGRGGDDFIDGSSWLNVQLQANGQRYDNLSQLQAAVFAREIDPGDISIVRSIVTVNEPDVINTAVFSDVEENYDVTTNADDTIRVEHARGTQADGTDTLRNIQRLQFSDGSVEPDPGETPTNTPATGDITISSNDPVRGEELSFTHTIEDADGLNEDAITFTWQSLSTDGDWQFAGDGRTFTPTAAEAGRQLRVVANFEDRAGTMEEIVGTPTTGTVTSPNVPTTGQPTLFGSTQGESTQVQVGEQLGVRTDGISDEDGLTNAEFTFQWQATSSPYTDISGATASTFTPTKEYAGRQVRVVVSFVDDLGNQESVVSEGVTVIANGDGGNPPTDTAAPKITKRSPASKAKSVSQAAKVTVTFNEPVKGVSGTSVALRNPAGKKVAATVTYRASSQTATLVPTKQLKQDTVYTVNLGGRIADAAGNTLKPTSWSFTTGPAPKVISRSPKASATGVRRDANIKVGLSESVKGVNTTSVTLRTPAGKVVPATVTYAKGTKVATLNPTNSLKKNTTYTVTVQAPLRDLAGNPVKTKSWTIRTGTLK